ncbi:hypothetical protein GCM10020254_11010 [Streptomyces goshikiensis]
MTARHLYEHDGGPAAETALIEWHRRAIDHPGTQRRQVRANRTDLALLLIDRAERGATAPAPGTPAPGTPAPGTPAPGTPAPGTPSRSDDLGEAARHLELALDDLALKERAPSVRLRAEDDPPETDADRAEERLNMLLGLVTLLSMLLPESSDDARLDRLIRRGQELIEVIPDADTERGGACLRLALALFERTSRRTLPQLPALLMRAMTPDRADPGISLVANVPGVREDNELAIALLRTGVGLYGYEDELYEAAAIALAVSLLIGYTVRLPERDTALIRDAVHWFRIVLDRVPEGGELHSPDLEDLFIGALLNSVWTSEPFVRAQTGSWRDGEGIPDVSRNQSVEDDLQSLRHLLETAVRRREQPVPVYEMVLLLITFMRGKGELDDAEARHWRDRLRRASAYTDPAEESLKGFLLLAAGAFGYELARRGAAGPAELAEADRLLREGARHMPPGSDFAEWAEGLRATGPATLIQQLLGVFMGGASAPGGGSGGSPRRGPSPGGRCRTRSRPRATAGLRPPAGSRPAPRPGRRPPRRRTSRCRPRRSCPETAARTPSPNPWAASSKSSPGRPGRPGRPSSGPPPSWPRTPSALHRRWLHESEIADLTDAVTLTRRAIAAAEGADGPLADRLSLLLAGMLRDRYLLIGDRMDLQAARTAYERLRDRSDPRAPHPELAMLLARPGAEGQPDLAALLRPARPAAPGAFSAELLAAAALTGLLAAREDGAADRAAAELAEAGEALPADHPLLPAVLSESGLFRATRAARADGLAALREAVEDVVRAAALCPPGSAHRAPLLLRAAAVLCAHSDALDAADPAGPAAPGSRASSLDRGIGLLSGAVDEAGPSFHGARARCRYGLGSLLLTRFRRSRDRADLDRAVGLLRDARTAVLSRPGDPFTVLLTRALAEALRAHGPEDPDHRAQSREAAKSVLAAHGRAVLLQTGTETALDSARAAGSDMMRLVEWCLTDGRTEEALEALELGRGLVLNAATVAASVPELLEREGRPELAQAWRRADPGRVPGTPADGPVVIPDGLRLLVLQCAGGRPGGTPHPLRAHTGRDRPGAADGRSRRAGPPDPGPGRVRRRPDRDRDRSGGAAAASGAVRHRRRPGGRVRRGPPGVRRGHPGAGRAAGGGRPGRDVGALPARPQAPRPGLGPVARRPGTALLLGRRSGDGRGDRARRGGAAAPAGPAGAVPGGHARDGPLARRATAGRARGVRRARRRLRLRPGGDLVLLHVPPAGGGGGPGAAAVERRSGGGRRPGRHPGHARGGPADRGAVPWGPPSSGRSTTCPSRAAPGAARRPGRPRRRRWRRCCRAAAGPALPSATSTATPPPGRRPPRPASTCTPPRLCRRC